ncbi:MAG: hypothetical protein K1X67_12265 [Fimbriimonadaceae bacterium]|nr:hypothetical protein [Fimbriimonadaceae bacterium]
MRADFGLTGFKQSPLGRKVEPILLKHRDEMVALARMGEPPAKAVDAELAHLVPEGLRERRNNSHLGRWIYELIGMDRFVTNCQVSYHGLTFEKPSTFIEITEPTIRRREPRPGGEEYPILTKHGYQLARGDLSADLKNHVEFAVFVRRLSEAVHLINAGYSIWMGRRGKRASLISPASLIITD